jgi:hypothetical protein
MGRALRILRIIQLSLLASVLLYVLIGEMVGSHAGKTNQSLNYGFATAAVALVGVILLVRRTLVVRPANVLASRPDDRVSLGHWKNGNIVTYVLCEALALEGLGLRLLGANLRQSLPFYVSGFVLILFFTPKHPNSATY